MGFLQCKAVLVRLVGQIFTRTCGTEGVSAMYGSSSEVGKGDIH